MCDTTDNGQRCYVCTPGPLEDGPADHGFHAPSRPPRAGVSRDPLQRSLLIGCVLDDSMRPVRADGRAGE